MNTRKILCILFSILMLTALCACGSDSGSIPAESPAPTETAAPTDSPATEVTATPEPVQLANPVTNYESLEAVNSTLGCRLTKPPVMGVTEESYSIIEAGEYFDIGQYCFSLNGIDYCLRFCGDYSQDISGVYVDGSTAFSGEVRQLEYAETPDMKLSRWATTEGQYCLCVADKGVMSMDTFEAVTAEIQSLTVPGNDAETAAVYAELEGEYLDAYSGRATATVTAEGDSIRFTVRWANSAFEVYQWTMTATRSEDGLFYYNDCVQSVLTYDQNGNESEEIVYTDGEGFFGEYEGRISWNGAADENCQNCVFEPFVG